MGRAVILAEHRRLLVNEVVFVLDLLGEPGTLNIEFHDGYLLCTWKFLHHLLSILVFLLSVVEHITWSVSLQISLALDSWISVHLWVFGVLKGDWQPPAFCRHQLPTRGLNSHCAPWGLYCLKFIVDECGLVIHRILIYFYFYLLCGHGQLVLHVRDHAAHFGRQFLVKHFERVFV